MQKGNVLKGYYNYVGIYTFSFIGLGMLVPFLGKYLDSIGFSGAQIGIITAAATATGIFANPFWGTQYHNCKNSKKIVLLLCAIVPLAAISLVFMKQFIFFLIIYAVYAFFQTPIMPLCDAMTLEAKLPYGAVRKWGAIGFASGVFISGQVADMTGLVMIFPLSAISFFVSGIIIRRMIRKEDLCLCNQTATYNSAVDSLSNSGNTDGVQKKNCKYIDLIKNKKFMALLCSAFFICGTNVTNNIYFGFLYTDAGGTIAGIGVALLLMCSSEAPFMAWIDKISDKFTLEKMILISMIISASRYLWYSTGLSSELLIGTFFLQGMVNGVVLIEFVRYIEKLVNPAMIGMAMTLYQSVSSNSSTILCQLAGGVILDKFSSATVYLFFGIFNIVGIVLYVGFGLHKKYQKKE